MYLFKIIVTCATVAVGQVPTEWHCAEEAATIAASSLESCARVVHIQAGILAIQLAQSMPPQIAVGYEWGCEG